MSNTILVIEDERVTRSSLEGFLKSEGFQVFAAENGRIGIELAKKHLPDLVICDIMMPELDGYDVLLTLQSDASTAEIPFIFLTVSADELGQQQSLEMGADDYLSKPITSERLKVAISNQLSRKATYPQKASGRLTSPRANTGIAASPASQFPASFANSNLMYLKDRLLTEFCEGVLARLIDLNQQVEVIQANVPELKGSPSISELNNKLMAMLRLTNQASALNKSLTSDNASQRIEEFLVSINKLNDENNTTRF